MRIRINAFSRIILMAVVFVLAAAPAFAQKRYRVGYKNEGFSVIPEATLLLPSNTYNFGFNMNLAFRGNFGQVFAGGGVGVDSYGSDFFVTPFATGRYFFLTDQFSPFAMMDVGYGLPVDANPAIGAGLVLTPGFGIRYFVSRTAAVNVGLVYRYQSMPIDLGVADASTSLRTNFIQSFGLRLGMQF
jgi:hypothetical protein